MRSFIATILACLYFYILSAQHMPGLTAKPPIDTSDILNWPVIPEGPHTSISNNGEYLLYSIWHIPPGGTSMMLQSVENDRKTILSGAREAKFTNDSRRLIYITSHDSLCILTLPDVRRKYEGNVHSFKLFMHKRKEMLFYQRANRKREAVLHELTSGDKRLYLNIDTYLISKDGQTILLQTTPDSANYVTLLWVDVGTNEQKTIWKGINASNLCFDESGKQLAFLVHDSATDDNAVWLYKAGQENAIELCKARSIDQPDSMKIVAIDNFNRDGKKLFLQIGERSSGPSESNQSPMTIWSYGDSKLQTMQTDEQSGGIPSYLAVLDIQSLRHIWRIQQQNESIAANNLNGLVVLTSREGSSSEIYWNKSASSNTFLVIVNEEKRISIPLTNIAFSPDQKYLLGNGMDETWGSDLYVYEISTNTVRNITKSIPVVARKEESDMVETSKGKGLIFAGWLPEDNALLVYDDYDIWQVDAVGERKAVKLTNGHEKKIQFRLTGEELNSFKKDNRLLLLTAFNTGTKQNGFYQLKLNTGEQPELLFMGDYFFSKITASNSYYLKARDRNIYLVKREQTGHAPNIFATENFRSFSQITSLHPERSVNWFTSELITFTTIDGTNTQAILYKPENFNPATKYPLLIHYYERKSDELNRYRPPQGWGTGGDLDVAWFASHGYLVLLTDIHYNIGKPGESTYKAIVGAAKYISKRSYIDKDHIGIQGHSFGGYETNYLITHSDLFAAAVSSAGVSEVIGKYGSLWPDGSSVQEYFECRSFRIDKTPWHTPTLYANNSPLFSVSHVNTPVLIRHNKNDKNVLFEQGFEFFTALRRAGKQVWMLQYDNGGHGQMGEDYKDYLIRTSQFFDHYLKGAPSPEWMTRGIPAAMKGINNGLAVDKELSTNRPSRNRDTEK